MSDSKIIPPAQPCEKCGNATPGDVAEIHRSFHFRKTWLCSNCRTRPGHPWILPFTLFFIFGLLLAIQIFNRRQPHNVGEPGSSFAWAWAVAGWTLGGAMMILLHECAHAAVARAVGMKVNGISLGSGPRVFRLQFKKNFIDVHGFPTSGVCWTDSCPPNGWRWRRALMLAAGPAVHVVALAIIARVCFTRGWNHLDSWTDESAFAATLFFNNALLLVNTLLPRNYRWNGRPMRTDGGHLLDILSGKSSPPLLEQSLQKLVTLGSKGKWYRVQTAAREMLRQPFSNTAEATCAIAAWIAVANIRVGGEENLKEADERSSRCLGIAPTEPDIQIVRACVLLALNRDTEAEKFLTLAQSGSPGAPAEKAAAHLWTELHRRRNNPDQMRYWQTIGQKLYPAAAYKIFRDPIPEPQSSLAC